MENLLKDSALGLNAQESMMNATMDVISDFNLENDREEEVRKSNVRDYLEIFGYMDDMD